MTDELIKFCEEIYKEASRLHFFEVSIKKVMQAIHDNAGDCRNANLKFNSLKGTFKNYKQGVNTNVEWYGKGENGNPRYTPEEFRRMLADAIANNYGNLQDNDKYDLIKSALTAWFGDDCAHEFSTEQIENFVADYKGTHEQ